MQRTMTLFLPLAGAAERLAPTLNGDPGDWLPPPAAPLPERRWLVELRAGPVPYPVACRVGAAVGAVGDAWRPVSWSPRGASGVAPLVDRALPDFEGELGLLARAQPTLVLAGSYRPPFGALGTVGDLAGLRMVAEIGGRRFLQDVARRLLGRPSPAVAS